MAMVRHGFFSEIFRLAFVLFLIHLRVFVHSAALSHFFPPTPFSSLYVFSDYSFIDILFRSAFPFLLS